MKMQNLKDYLTVDGWKKDWKETREDYLGLSRSIQFGVMLGSSNSLSLWGNPLYHLSGAASALTASIIDSRSTIPLIKLTNSPEFEENNLEDYFYESCKVLGKHPTMKQYRRRSIVRHAAVTTLGALVPPAGYGYLASVGFLAKNNQDVVEGLEDAIEHPEEYKESVERS